MDGNDIPIEVWRQIILRANDDSIENIKNTCKIFYEIIEDRLFEVDRLKISGNRYNLPPKKWLIAAHKNDFGPNCKVDTSNFKFNLQKIAQSRKGYRKWNVYKINGDKKGSQHQTMYRGRADATYRLGKGSAEVQRDSDERIKYCFSFDKMTEIENMVNLTECGIDTWVLDYVRPTIRVSQMVKNQKGKEGTCTFNIDLYPTKRDFHTLWRYQHVPSKVALGQIGQSEELYGYRSSKIDIKTSMLFEKHWDSSSAEKWEELTVDFDSYPSGLRRILIETKAENARVANLTVEVIMPNEVNITTLEGTKQREVLKLRWAKEPPTRNQPGFKEKKRKAENMDKLFKTKVAYKKYYQQVI